MNNLNFCFLLALVVLFSAGCESETPVKQPNVILIIADDLGATQLSSYGSNFYQTPHLDQLAKDGTRFTRGYAASALGSPTRASILTGKYPARLGITNGSVIPRNNQLLREPKWNRELKEDEYTLAELLRDKGYATAFFGKWGISEDPQLMTSDELNLQGFDNGYATELLLQPGLEPWQDQYGDIHLTDSITNSGIDFIRANQKNPFFLMIGSHAVHKPLIEEESLIANYHESSLSQMEQNNPVLAALIERMDRGIGRILQSLKDLKIKERTLVIFLSDNGGDDQVADQNLKQGKAWLYEGGIRIPMIFSWPNKIRDGLVNNVQINTIDILPTINGLLEEPHPGLDVDGFDLSEMLTMGKPISRNTQYWHFPHYNLESGMSPAGAIISSNFKLIEWFEGRYGETTKHMELYDLDADPMETNNLLRQQPKKAEELLGYLETWRKVLGAKMPAQRPKNVQPQ